MLFPLAPPRGGIETTDLFVYVATVVKSWIGHAHDVLQSLKIAGEAAVFHSEDLFAARIIH